ncbi:MAG: peptidoglycan DD-metalloendopeptidase family protein [Candidatus Glassbacteria bacterium]|nr:peptidoglycan DD-metalloendopeptidase family protein [Candidatus Glassbacteria bacterium]
MTNDLKDLLPPESRKVKYSRTTTIHSGGLRRSVPLIAFAAFVLLILMLVNPFAETAAPELVRSGTPQSQQFPLPVGPQPAEAGLVEDAHKVFGTFQLEDNVRRGDTFETILLRNGIEREYLFPLLDAARDSHNLNRVVIGRQLRFSFEDSLLTQVVYEIDDDRTLLVTREDSANWQAEVEETEYVENERELSGTIESSLYQTVMDSYGNPELALKLSEIYAWQIDFHNEIRKGDTFKLVFEERIHPEKHTTKVGDILAALFVNDGKRIYGFRFMNPDSSLDYFEPDGKSLRRKFLKSPFRYMPRISSRYNPRRFHPILKRYRPHLGVDYAAHKGTPVLALGDGKVVKRGWNGGFGHYVLIKHNGMFSTGYGHLSGYARGLKVGSRVQQGQVIGYVGSTGLSTGPHLDFRFYKDDKPVNPLTVDLPAGEPVAAEVFAEFEATRNVMLRRLSNIGRPLLGPPVAASNEIPGQLRFAAPVAE